MLRQFSFAPGYCNLQRLNRRLSVFFRPRASVDLWGNEGNRFVTRFSSHLTAYRSTGLRPAQTGLKGGETLSRPIGRFFRLLIVLPQKLGGAVFAFGSSVLIFRSFPKSCDLALSFIDYGTILESIHGS
jgi:hypothetical protein